MSAAAQRITVVGIGADGWTGLADPVRDIVLRAEVVVGAPRQLALLPAADGQRRLSWPIPLHAGLPTLFDDLAHEHIVALASGDPLLSGIGSTLIGLFGTERVTVVPAVSSVTLARARMGWPAESVAVISAVGRDVRAVLRELAPNRRVLVLSSDETTPVQLADLLAECGYGQSLMTVLGDLGSAAESRWHTTAAAGFGETLPRLNIVAVQLAGPLVGGWAAGLPDEVYEHDGQLTKRDLRAAALARLVPTPGHLLWDVGAGAGSVGIEWMRAHPACRAIAIESNQQRAQRISSNSRNLGVPALQVVCGSAPDSLADLTSPDAVFIGGGLTRPGVLAACLAALGPGGRLVAHGVTLETEGLLLAAYREHGGELTRLQVEYASPLGSFTGWTPGRAVTQWALTLT